MTAAAATRVAVKPPSRPSLIPPSPPIAASSLLLLPFILLVVVIISHHLSLPFSLPTIYDKCSFALALRLLPSTSVSFPPSLTPLQANPVLHTPTPLACLPCHCSCLPPHTARRFAVIQPHNAPYTRLKPLSSLNLIGALLFAGCWLDSYHLFSPPPLRAPHAGEKGRKHRPDQRHSLTLLVLD